MTDRAVPRPAAITQALADLQGGFPAEGLAWLADRGLTRPDRCCDLLADGRMFAVLVAAGRGDLAAGRLYEGHVDALGLLRRLGTAEQSARGDAWAREGLIGVWGADDPSDPARIETNGGTIRLSGRKTFASGGPHLAGAIIAAKDEAKHTRLVLVDRTHLANRFEPEWWDPIGMAETRSDALSLDGVAVSPDDILGAPGAYEGHPAFGAGAIRFVAVQTGGVLAVWDAMRSHLARTGRTDDPHQAARLAEAAAACEGAFAAARAAFDRLRPVIAWHEGAAEGDAAGQAAAADAARLLVERTGRDVSDIAVRSVGCGGLMRRHPLSRRITDLLVYLRQPAPDAAATRLGQAAGTGAYTPLFDHDAH